MRKLLPLALLVLVTAVAAGQTRWDYELPQTIRLTQRVNVSRRENGRYIGLTHSEVRGNLSLRTERGDTSDAGNDRYTGRVLVFEQTRRDMVSSWREIDVSYPLQLLVDPAMGVLASLPLPVIQQMPSLPQVIPEPGDTWEAPGLFFVNPTEPTLYTPVEAVVEYTYVGTEVHGGTLHHTISATAATRFDRAASEDPLPGDRELMRVAGLHSLGIRIPAEGTGSILIRDQLDEEYRYADGSVIRHTGHVLVFIDGVTATPQPSVDRLVEDLEPQNIGVEQTDEGIRLTVRDIHFLPDQAIILPEERPRLDELAAALGSIPADRRFLVVGHTARVGTEASQQELSLARAQTIAAELADQGIDRSRLLVEGRGGTEPIGDNATEEGREMNRRVEVYVLD